MFCRETNGDRTANNLEWVVASGNRAYHAACGRARAIAGDRRGADRQYTGGVSRLPQDGNTEVGRGHQAGGYQA